MKVMTRWVLLGGWLLLAGCGGDEDAPRNAAPDVSGETTPAPVPLPPETEPASPSSELPDTITTGSDTL